jgi:hypothetical protein
VGIEYYSVGRPYVPTVGDAAQTLRVAQG